MAMVALLALAVGSVGILARWTASSSDGPVLGPAVLVVSTHTPTSKPAPHPSPTVGPGTSTSIRPPSTAGHAGISAASATSGATQGPVQAATPASPSVVTAPPPSPSYVDDHGGHGDSGKDGSRSGGSNSGGSNSGSGGG